MGPNNWGIFLILPVTTGEGIGPAGEISPVVCMLKNGLVATQLMKVPAFLQVSAASFYDSLDETDKKNPSVHRQQA